MRYLLLLGMVGCSHQLTTAELDQAYSIVWEGTYHQTEERPVAHVHYVAECTDQYGNSGIVHHSSGMCLGGYSGQDGVHFLYLSTLANSPFAHELYHWAYYYDQPTAFRSVRGMDAAHHDPGWGTLVPAAVEQLEGLGY